MSEQEPEAPRFHITRIRRETYGQEGGSPLTPPDAPGHWDITQAITFDSHLLLIWERDGVESREARRGNALGAAMSAYSEQILAKEREADRQLYREQLVAYEKRLAAAEGRLPPSKPPKSH